MSKILNASLGVVVALNKRTDAPIFSADYWHADTLLQTEIKRLNAILRRTGRIKEPLETSSAIRYAVQVVRPRLCS